jgi:hypothetical protein
LVRQARNRKRGHVELCAFGKRGNAAKIAERRFEILCGLVERREPEEQ